MVKEKGITSVNGTTNRQQQQQQLPIRRLRANSKHLQEPNLTSTTATSTLGVGVNINPTKHSPSSKVITHKLPTKTTIESSSTS